MIHLFYPSNKFVLIKIWWCQYFFFPLHQTRVACFTFKNTNTCVSKKIKGAEFFPLWLIDERKQQRLQNTLSIS